MNIVSKYGTLTNLYFYIQIMMKRINWFSLFIGIIITLGLVVACNSWRTRTHDSTVASSPSASSSSKVTHSSRESAKNTIAWNQLPPEAQTVIQTIKARGSFPYKQDGKTFQNREGLLPQQAKGYYREYTVITPNASNRGARRIIAGQGTTGDVATANEFYYTSDHYRSFYRVKEKNE